MKLLRIVDRNNDGSFDNDFNDIFIKPNSKIGFHNITANLLPEDLVVNSSNNKFTFKIASNTFNIVLNQEIYNKDNFNNLLLDIQDKLNNSLTFTGKLIGVQFKVENIVNRVNIGFQTDPYNLHKNLMTLKGDIHITGTIPNEILQAQNTTHIIDDSRTLSSSTPFINGCGVMRSSLSRYVDTSSPDNGLIYGVSKVHTTGLSNPLTTDQKHFCIFVDSNGSIQYKILANGGSSTSAISVLQGDILEIRRVGNKLQAVVYQGGTEEILGELIVDNTTQFYPLISMRTGNNELKLKNLRIQQDPYLVPTPTENSIFEEDDLGLTAVPRPSPHFKTNNSITWDNTTAKGNELNKFLGYNKITYSNNGINADFIADRRFEFHIFNDTYLLVLDNLELESYDGFTRDNPLGHRRNVVAVIPYKNANSADDVLEYETNNINFIDLRNNKEINLRNLKGRLLRADLQKVKTNGLMNITFFIQE
jgi:hypothetical protein